MASYGGAAGQASENAEGELNGGRGRDVASHITHSEPAGLKPG
jgi:hypothetical protein